MKELADANIDIMNVSNHSESNALHVSIQRDHNDIAKLLIKSGYPLENCMKGGVTPLIVCAQR